jgi:hypothetical protein
MGCIEIAGDALIIIPSYSNSFKRIKSASEKSFIEPSYSGKIKADISISLGSSIGKKKDLKHLEKNWTGSLKKENVTEELSQIVTNTAVTLNLEDYTIANYLKSLIRWGMDPELHSRMKVYIYIYIHIYIHI